MGEKAASVSKIPCCPTLDQDPVCDVLDFRRRLLYPTSVRTNQGRRVDVEVVLHTRFSRCSGPLALGDLAYSTTLLPGEKVRLATSDRRSRFSYDSSTNLSSRSEQVSEEQYRMTAMRAFMMDASSRDQTSQKDTEKSSWDFHGDADGSIGFMSASADVNARGSYNGESTRDFLGEHRAHAESSDNQSVEATRKAHSLSIGEVSTREHKEGETQDHYESSSREFSNANQCHAVTYLFYRINKTEIATFSLESIERRVLDPAVVTRPVPVLPSPIRQIAPIPQVIPATSFSKLGLQPVALQQDLLTGPGGRITLVVPEPEGLPLDDATRKAALAEVDAQLAAQGLLDPATGKVSKSAQEEFGYTRKTSLPTAGVIVKGCLDECNTCEPALHRKIDLELEHARLQNELLKRQIELLDKSQEYRCCGDKADAAPDA
jgi:hypothetical protein